MVRVELYVSRAAFELHILCGTCHHKVTSEEAHSRDVRRSDAGREGVDTHRVGWPSVMSTRARGRVEVAVFSSSRHSSSPAAVYVPRRPCFAAAICTTPVCASRLSLVARALDQGRHRTEGYANTSCLITNRKQLTFCNRVNFWEPDALQ